MCHEMRSTNTPSKGHPTETARLWKSGRRAIDAVGLALFHLAVLGLLAWSDRKMVSGLALLAVPVLGLDILYFFSPPKRRPALDPKPDVANPKPGEPTGALWIEHLVLLAPPVILILWFLSLAWAHQTLTRPELITTVAAMPVVVGLVSWVIYLRMTRCHVGVRNNATKFIALAMLATWIGATFLFVLLAMCLLMR
jgi:hypothetical protein